MRKKIKPLLILAAGEGKRLRPYTKNIPKCMVPLNGLPLISRNVAQWSEAENFSIYIACGYKSEAKLVFAKIFSCTLVSLLKKYI